MKAFTYIANVIFLTLMLGVMGLFLLPYLPFDHGIELRIVESGSMEPAISTGSMIVVRPAETYAVGDVIMFDSRYTDVPTTHRIVETYQEQGSTWHVTKGDANEEADAGVVPAREVIGTVALDLPRVGFVLDFARQPLGFLFLIVLPAGLIVLSELEKIWRELRRRRTGPVREDDDDDSALQPVVSHDSVSTATPMMDIATPVRYFTWPTLDLRQLPSPTPPPAVRSLYLTRTAGVSSIVGFALLVVGAHLLGSTVSYFSDTEVSSDNQLTAIALDFTASADANNFSITDTEFTDDDVAVVVSLVGDSVATRHDVNVEVTSGSATLCDAIVAESITPVSYDGALPLLTANDLTFAGPWTINLALATTDGLSGGESCSVAVVLSAWHFDTETNQGYFDEERIPLTFNYSAPTPVFAPTNAPAALTGSTAEPKPIVEPVDTVTGEGDGEEVGGEEAKEITNEGTAKESEEGEESEESEEVVAEEAAGEEASGEEAAGEEETEEEGEEVTSAETEAVAENEESEESGGEEEEGSGDT